MVFLGEDSEYRIYGGYRTYNKEELLDSLIVAFEVSSANEGLAKGEASVVGGHKGLGKHLVVSLFQFTHEGFKEEGVLKNGK